MKNLSASVKARLLNLARAQGIDFNRVQLLYVQERFLARLAVSPHRDHFVLKGGLYLYSRYGTLARPTKDMDLLGRATSSEIAAVLRAVGEIIALTLEDGVVFDVASLHGSIIKEDQEYEGVRVTLTALLGSSRQPIQIDVGFGDAITAGPVELAFPTLLASDEEVPPTVLAYSLETVIAEKFEAMVSLGEVNTRYKDFYDLWRIACTERLEATLLRQALESTFARRGTRLEQAGALLANASGSAARQQQWAIYQRKTDPNAPLAFEAVQRVIRVWLEPVVRGAATGVWEATSMTWMPQVKDGTP
jgi:predicted nucleotidyltransferase component of viral defense system